MFRLSFKGFPLSVVSATANFSLFLSSSSAILNSISLRSSLGFLLQEVKALFAEVTARFKSSIPELGHLA